MKTFLILILLLCLVVPLAAQEDLPANACDQEAVLDHITTAFDALEPGDSFGDNLIALQAAASAAQWECADFTLSGEPDGRDSIVIGPYTLPEGTYKMTITTDESILFQSERLDGDCDLISEFLSEGDAVNGSEYIVSSEGCDLLFQVSADAVWQVRFDKIQ